MKLKKGEKKLLLSKNLNYLLTQHSLDIKELSSATGLPSATLSRLKKDGNNPTLSSIEPLVEFFRVNIDSFLYEDMSNPNFQNKKKMGNLIHIPVYTLEDISPILGEAKILKFIGAAGITGKNVFGVTINSDSLAPAFQNNSILLVDPDLNPIEGDYVFCYLGNTYEIPLVRQVFIDGNDYYFKSINPGFTDLKSYQDYRIIGVIIKSIESFR